MPNWTEYRRVHALIAGVVGLLVLLVVGGVLWLGGDDPAPPPAEEPEPEAEPEPEPEPDPVEGALELDTVDLSHTGTRLFGGSRPQSNRVPMNEEGIETFAQVIAEWLDRHLNDLQEGGPGGAPGPELVDGPTEILTLTNPEQPVASARYHVVVYARGKPEWARAGVTVAREDDSTVRANIIFLPDDPPQLIAAQGEGEEPPAPADEEPTGPAAEGTATKKESDR